MKKLLFLGILSFFALIGKTQKVYFIYLQSENGIPFYVKMGDKIHSSSTAGYLILSNLKDSTYSVAIGMSGKQQAEPRFKIVVAGSDRGFLVKELDQKLSLFDLQSLELIAPLVMVETNDETYITRTDDFTRTLSQAINDPSLLTEVVRREPVKDVAKGKIETSEIKPELAVVKEQVVEKPVTADSITTGNIDTTLIAANTDSITTDTVALVTAQPDSVVKDTIVNAAPVISGDSANLAVVDSVSKTVIDTVAKKEVGKEDMARKEEAKGEELKKEESKLAETNGITKADSVAIQPVKEDVAMNTVSEYKKSIVIRRSESSTTEGFGLTFIDNMGISSDTIRLLIPNPKAVVKLYNEPKQEIKEETTPVKDTVSSNIQTDTTAIAQKIDSTCKETATDTDFKNLRKEMAASETDEGMINKAVIAFQTKCFTTEQIKNLSTLFLTAQWKFQFFNAAYGHSADAEKFPTLESELKDEYYVNRFKALMAK